jgi:hypothetical protein
MKAILVILTTVLALPALAENFPTGEYHCEKVMINDKKLESKIKISTVNVAGEILPFVQFEYLPTSTQKVEGPNKVMGLGAVVVEDDGDIVAVLPGSINFGVRELKVMRKDVKFTALPFGGACVKL